MKNISIIHGAGSFIFREVLRSTLVTNQEGGGGELEVTVLLDILYGF
jgi:hypothetical protein